VCRDTKRKDMQRIIQGAASAAHSAAPKPLCQHVNEQSAGAADNDGLRSAMHVLAILLS